MSDRLLRLEVLHEIAMSIGSCLDTTQMLKACLPRFLRSLACQAASVLEIESEIRPLMTLPRNADIGLVSAGLALALQDERPLPVIERRGAHIHLWRLPGFGMLLLARHEPFDEAMVQGIGTLAERLATALLACRDHQRLASERDLAEITLRSIGDGVITTDRMGRITRLNAVAEQLTGWTMDEACGRPLAEAFRIVDAFTRQPLENPVEKLLREGDICGLTVPTLLLARDGREFAIEDSAAPIMDPSGALLGAVLVFRDVTDKRRMAEELDWQARHDYLTGLYNRREFERRLSHLIHSAGNDPQSHAMIYIDLDQFKIVNDTCGHAAGDQLLKEIAHLLRAQVRSLDVLSRVGGDEFAILLESCSVERAGEIAHGIIRSIDGLRFPWQGRTFRISASAGIAQIAAGMSQQQVMIAADAACYLAKEQGRNRVQIHDARDADVSARDGDMQWVTRIDEALERDRFRLYFQRIQPLHDGAEPGLIEILVRYLDEDGTLVTPGRFLPAAERFGLMPKLDRWVLRRSLQAWAQLARSGWNEARWTINLSGASMGDAAFRAYACDEIAQARMPEGSLVFEITETAAIGNLHCATEFIHDLKRLGCRCALDDFGAGFSSFAYLQNLPVDYLKIDGAFVRGIVQNARDRAIVKSISRIGRAYGLRVIAEHVENAETLAMLSSLRLDYAQGYYLHKPEALLE